MKGVIYAALNTNYYFAYKPNKLSKVTRKKNNRIPVAYSIYAARSARSVRKYLPNVPITLYADKINRKVLERENLLRVFDEIIPHEYPQIKKGDFFEFEGKLHALANSPYDKTIFLDADTLVLGPRIKEFYQALDLYDMAGVPYAVNNIHRYSLKSIMSVGGVEKEAKIDHIPASFLELTSSAFSFNKNSRTQKMLEMAHELYINDPHDWRVLQKLPTVPNCCFNDMFSLWYAQWECKVTRNILPTIFANHGTADTTQKWPYRDIVIHHARYRYDDLTEKGRIK